MISQMQEHDAAMKADLSATLERWQDEQRRLLEQIKQRGE